jgi:hypothetical protein
LIEADPAGTPRSWTASSLYAAARPAARSEERVVRRRAIAAGVERLRIAHPEQYEEILHKFRRYDERLRRFGLRDRHLDGRCPGRRRQLCHSKLALCLVLVPFAPSVSWCFVPFG